MIFLLFLAEQNANLEHAIVNSILGVGGILGAILTYFLTRKKSRAEVEKLVAESEVSIAKVTMDFMGVLRKDLGERNEEYELLKKHTKACEEDLRRIKNTQEANKSRLDRLESYVRSHDGPLLAEELRKILRGSDRP